MRGAHLDPVTIDDAAAAASLDDQLGGEAVLHHRDGRRPHRFDQRPFDLGTRRRAPGVDDARHRVPALSGLEERAAVIPVEHRAERDQLLDPQRSLVDQHPHGVEVA